MQAWWHCMCVCSFIHSTYYIPEIYHNTTSFCLKRSYRCYDKWIDIEVEVVCALHSQHQTTDFILWNVKFCARKISFLFSIIYIYIYIAASVREPEVVYCIYLPVTFFERRENTHSFIIRTYNNELPNEKQL